MENKKPVNLSSFDNRATWIGRSILQGAQGHRRVARYLRRMYTSSLIAVHPRRSAHPDEKRREVESFLERISRQPMFLPHWQGSGMRLHIWLANELWRVLFDRPVPDGSRSVLRISYRRALIAEVYRILRARETNPGRERFAWKAAIRSLLDRDGVPPNELDQESDFLIVFFGRKPSSR